MQVVAAQTRLLPGGFRVVPQTPTWKTSPVELLIHYTVLISRDNKILQCQQSLCHLGKF